MICQILSWKRIRIGILLFQVPIVIREEKRKERPVLGGWGGVNLHRLGLNNLILLIKASNLKSQSISVIHFFSLANNGIKQKNKKPLI